MPRFAANLTMLFNELPFPERFGAAAEAGFKGVEYLFPYAFDKDELAARLDKFGLTQVLHNLPAGYWENGERGIACHPGRVSELSIATSTKSACRPALIRVASEFQNKMSKAGGRLPSR